MTGLKRLCRLYGQIRVGGVLYLWDYAAEEPVHADTMPIGSERWKTSERARWALVAREQQRDAWGRGAVG